MIRRPLSQKIRFHLKSWAVPILLGLFCFLIYNANLRVIGSGDTLSARYQPLILWKYGTLSFDANPRLPAHGHSTLTDQNRPAGSNGKIAYNEPWTYWIVRTREHQLASLYPVVTPLLVAPLYLPSVLWLNSQGWEQPQVDRVAELMEKLSASLLASIASVLMYLVLRRDCGKWSLPLALVFAFGTNTWMISSQALWQHGVGELLITLALLLITGPASSLRTALLGTVCVLIAANRPPDALIAAAFLIFMVWNRWRNLPWLLAGAALPLAALLYYNLVFIGHIAGGYALGKAPGNKFFQLDWSGIAGLLVSPARGLLIFSPFLIFVPWGLIYRLRNPETRGLVMVLSCAVVAQFLVYSQADWRAGVAWGPRWLTDTLPILIWMLAPVTLILRPFARGLLIVAMLGSIMVQVIGAFWYTGKSDELIFAGDPQSKQETWNPRNLPFFVELQHPAAPGELQHDAVGSIDLVGSTLHPGTGKIPLLENGASIEGWSLVGGRTPAQMLILIDGIVIGSNQKFLPREDVNKAMHTLSPSGWHVIADTRGVLQGEHVLQLALRIEPRSDIRIVREQRVLVAKAASQDEGTSLSSKTVSGPQLDAMAARATALLRESQAEQGYWLTTHTRKLRYEEPQKEMNTFLTSMLVDLISPIAHQQGLEDVMERARRHLRAQIESNGLVRYHGLPDGPTIGTLGCVITPDTDDTALVWRIAGPGRADPRLKPMLAELSRYRDTRGLYRAWLAPQNKYQNLDPGRDPNPTDLTIQLHVYLMLRELDPPAADNLCKALQRYWRDDDLWTYYSKAALVPYLRSVQIRQLGCDIPLPTERLAFPAVGQEVWNEAALLLGQAAMNPPDEKAREKIRNLLGRIGSDDFAQVRHSPPLLYHNDLSATVKRFYWSEDFGYALWLRLYEAARIGTGQAPRPSP